MAEKNNTKTPFEQEQDEVMKKVLHYKLGAEANTVAILYKRPDEIYNIGLTLDDFSNNAWRVYFQIAYDLVVVENKNVLDDITVGIYLNKHAKLKEKYIEYGAYNTVAKFMDSVEVDNLYGYVRELKKWNAVIELCKRGFPVKENLSAYVDLTEEQIYNEFEVNLNHVFANSEFEVKSYNVFDGMYEFIEELDEGREEGLPFYHANLLTKELGGFNLNGNIYGLGAGSGVGKSTMAFNYIIPSAMEAGEKVVMIINEEDEKKMRKELLVWVANNHFKEELQKRTLRDGHFDEATKKLLNKCAKWIDEQKDKRTLTVIPLERYSVNTVIKIIRKYSSLGVRVFILDTLKESADATTNDIWQSMMRDMVKLYDVVKPSAKNVGLFVTYQLGKSSLKMRYLTNNEIGQAKSIVDVMSVNLMMRRPYEDEYEGGKNELHAYRMDGTASGGKSNIPFKIKKENNTMITFITKNRFGVTGGNQIVSKCNLSTNVCEDLGYCAVMQDF